MRSREEEKERRKRDALRRIAPGFEPHGGPLVPTRGPTNNATSAAGTPSDSSWATHRPTRSVMDDLVDQLAALEGAPAKSSSSLPLS